ncbi:GDSL-type esterase/lipase family protein [Novosphingobium sp. 1949]|uniref:GDSL-type esterase/lipase family protein n=1 Tax=Novosphingobium organovorum TaxID=2930092 RepID=A0ABT0BIS2_9SPHN|nr:GDSL-type esterase/lipase family protein [Novosphingobium organovorum]MCJ2184960.1 GDSL-type esterase/lipase family protein [Novosphingobium organovorum]
MSTLAPSFAPSFLAQRLPAALLALGALTLPLAAQAQTAPAPTQTSAEQEAEQRLHTDWAWTARYRDQNAIDQRGEARPRIVLLGDSITQGWFDLDRAFFTPGRIGRGIGGQTTSQMLLRFRQDVIDLDPDVVQIMAGTNDIAANTGPMTDEQIEGNIRSMVELAQAHGIRVILASIPPADQFPWRPGLDTGPRIVRLNAWLKAYAAKTGSTYADYWSALKGEGLGARAGLTKDHVHPTPAGYAVMDKVAEQAFQNALAQPAPAKTLAAKVP